MRTTVMALTGAAALAFSSAASAAVFVTGSTGLTNPTPTVNNTDPNISKIDFGQLTVGPGAFSGSFTFYSTVLASANFTLDSSTTGTTFNSATLTAPGGGVTPFNVLNAANPASWYLNNALILAGSSSTNLYTIDFAGNTNSDNTAVLTGNVSVTPVPEAKTWAMMLLGFGAIGMALRGRRRTVLAQVA